MTDRSPTLQARTQLPGYGDSYIQIGDEIYIVDDDVFYTYRNTGSNPPDDGFSVIHSDRLPGFWERAEASSGESFYFRAKTVVLTNVNINDYNTLSNAGRNDSVATVEGDIVLLVGQTAPAENGPYVVGVIDDDTAPLARPTWWASAAVLPSGMTIVNGGQGAVYKNTVWQAMRAADTFVVDTNDPEMYPQSMTASVTLVTGTIVLAVPVRSSLRTGVAPTRAFAPVGTALTIQYAVSAMQAGAPGTGSITLIAALANGTINVADGSTLLVTVTNQR